MENVRMKFISYLEDENKEKAVLFLLDTLSKKEIDVIKLYSRVLIPMISELSCKLDDNNICIWKEHVRTAIVRTAVECCYPFVVEKRNQLKHGASGKAVVICPPEEYQDLRARMTADFLTIVGYDAIFVGGNTPYQDFYNAVDTERPDIVVICVENYYNLFSAKKIITELRASLDFPLQILASGSALCEGGGQCEKIGADYVINSFEDIEQVLLDKQEATV